METSPQGVAAFPAASAILLRQTADGFETLLLRRLPELDFAGGLWVFPGGRIDPHELEQAPELEQAARLAAVRETAEETGLDIDAAALQTFTHWTTPVAAPKRFATWFFLCRRIEHGAVRVDEREIAEHVWLSPREALARHGAGELDMMPPNYVCLLELAACSDLDEIFTRAARRSPPRILPRLQRASYGLVALYAGDVAYEGGELDAPGRRHRLEMRGHDWTYLNDGFVDW
jgi:8-oxo-dGTP pyrophosphatase MutT (NUDIX family)